MPQAYNQTRNGYVANSVSRPASAIAKRGGRRPKEFEDYDHVALSEEERDKRTKRRLRNKEAAARCRKRRLELMDTLQRQVDQLKEENSFKDARISELQQLKNRLLSVIREHHCVLPEGLQQSLDIDMSSTHQYMPRSAAPPMPTSTDLTQFTHSHGSSEQLLTDHKRPASEMIPELRQMQESAFKNEPTLYEMNGRDIVDEEMKRPTSLAFSEGNPNTNNNYTPISSGIPISTPSGIISGSADFNGVSLLDGPTGLTPCHPPQPTAFQLTSMTTPLGDGRSFETL